jgi:hypothetical protein
VDNFKEYVEERMENIYGAYNSTILEAHKSESDKMNKSKFKFAFINYLVYKYEDKNIKYEFRNAKTDKEREALAKKYAKDFEEWRKRQSGVMKILAVDAASCGLNAAGIMSAGAANLIGLLCWGALFKTFHNDYKARDKAREEKYLKEKNKK